jgi:predicted nucleic-acid-binding Zn-ribbon protein
MKNTTKCPKCEATDIVKIPGGDLWFQRNLLPIGAFTKPVPVTRYLCCACGYSEEWIENKEDIKNLKKHFE